MWHEWARDVHRGLMEKPKGKRPLGRNSSRQQNNIKMVLQEIG
jgi:hypothetical protein